MKINLFQNHPCVTNLGKLDPGSLMTCCSLPFCSIFDCISLTTYCDRNEGVTKMGADAKHVKPLVLRRDVWTVSGKYGKIQHPNQHD